MQEYRLREIEFASYNLLLFLTEAYPFGNVDDCQWVSAEADTGEDIYGDKGESCTHADDVLMLRTHCKEVESSKLNAVGPGIVYSRLGLNRANCS